MMFQNKVATFTVVILSSLISLTTFICLVLFHESPFYLSALGAFFIIACVKAVIVTTVASQKRTLPAYIAEQIFSRRGRGKKSGREQKKSKEIIRRKEPFVGPILDSKLNIKRNTDDVPTTAQYLDMVNYALTDEIVDAIEWKRFELLCHLLFRALGYSSRLTGYGADSGVDIRIYDKEITTKVLFLVQCKKWKKRTKIDRPLIQQLRGQMAAENVLKGGFCATTTYTQPAIEFAAANNIELFDQTKIITAFNKLDRQNRAKILKQVLEGNYWTPSCATCGMKFSVKKTKSGKMVWACDKSGAHGWSSIPYFPVSPIQIAN